MSSQPCDTKQSLRETNERHSAGELCSLMEPRDQILIKARDHPEEHNVIVETSDL
jgi:hypothetical protein